MKAVALDWQRRTVEWKDIAGPPAPGPNQVLFRVREVGICGTDRELAAFRLGRPPAGETYLIPGHEALGQVVETGKEVVGLQLGDWVAPMIRRSCQPPCSWCARGRRDLCTTGRYDERGIFGRHGYFTEFALDDAEDLVRVPAERAAFGVLVEPLSVVEKAVDRMMALRQADEGGALVIGAGPIGLLAAFALAHRGVPVTVHSLEPETDPRVSVLDGCGCRYLGPEHAGRLPTAPLVLEAAGSPQASSLAIRQMAPLGVCCLLSGLEAGGRIPLRQIITGNQVVFGSVNADPAAFRRAVDDLCRWDLRLLRPLITRVRFEDCPESMLGPPSGAIKLVHVVGESIHW